MRNSLDISVLILTSRTQVDQLTCTINGFSSTDSQHTHLRTITLFCTPLDTPLLTAALRWPKRVSRQYMYRRLTRILQSIAVGFLAVPTGPAAQSGTTNLVLRVQPAELLTPRLVHLNFYVSRNEVESRTSQSERIVAIARTEPGRQVRVFGSLRPRPGDKLPPGLRWDGTMESAAAGAQHAACSSGDLNSGRPFPLISGWQQSGAATCSVTFTLTHARELDPGNYPITVELALVIE
jgi:hypothetical protein